LLSVFLIVVVSIIFVQAIRLKTKTKTMKPNNFITSVQTHLLQKFEEKGIICTFDLKGENKSLAADFLALKYNPKKLTSKTINKFMHFLCINKIVINKTEIFHL